MSKRLDAHECTGKDCTFCLDSASTNVIEQHTHHGRQFAVIHVILYDDVRRERVVKEFSISAWATEKQFDAIREFWIEVMRGKIIDEEELMK